MKKIVYLLAYTLLLSVSFSVFYIFQPFKYVENSKSYLICARGNRYFIGPNLVYSFDGKIDQYNDKKARKVCEYGLIQDYKDEFKAPDTINYTFNPVYAQESGWINASFAFFLVFSLGALIIQGLYKRQGFKLNTVEIILVLLAAITIFNFVNKKSATQILCQKKVNTMTLNFKLSVNFTSQSEEDRYVNSEMSKLYQNCLSN